VGGQHRIGASHLALERELRLDKPDRRMKEENRLDDLLREIGPVIPAVKVRQFVQQNGFEFNGRNLLQSPGRKDDDGMEISDGSGDANRVRGAQRNATDRSHVGEAGPQIRTELSDIYRGAPRAQLPKPEEAQPDTE